MNFRIDGKWLFENEDHLIVNQRERLSDNPLLVKIFDKLVETCPICINGDIHFISLQEKEKELLLLYKDVLKNYEIRTYINTKYIKFNISDNGHYILFGNIYHFRLFDDRVAVSPKKVFIIKNEYEIYSYLERKNVLVPLQLKHIAELSSHETYKLFFSAYFKSVNTNLMKDLYKEFSECPGNINVPIKISDIPSAYNKKMLLETKKIPVYNKFNSFPLAYSYSLVKAQKYIKENEFTKIFQSRPFGLNGKIYEHERAKEFFITYFYQKLGFERSQKSGVITDYINMVIQLKTTVNLNIKSFKQLVREHDKLVIQLSERQCKNTQFSLTEDNPFLSIKIPQEIIRISNPKELFYEGIINKNCVYSYLNRINKGKCMIYSTIINDKRYTIELIKKQNKFIFNQIKGICNSEPTAAIVDTIYNSFIKSNPDYKFKLALLEY